jgi:hypothetical protein
MTDTDSELSWRLIKESFTKRLTNDMTEIEDITTEISLINTILSSIQFRHLNFTQTSKLIANKIKQLEKQDPKNVCSL